MARNTTTKTFSIGSTALVPATANAPSVTPPTIDGQVVKPAKVGDNSGKAMDLLPTMSELHDRMVDLFNNWDKSDAQSEMAQYNIVLRIMQRHELLAKAGNTMVPLASMATEPANHPTFTGMLKEMTDDIAGPYIQKKDHKGRESADANAYRAKVEKRMRDALKLCINMAWAKITREFYDYDRSMWRVPPTVFLAPGWQCLSLTHKQEGDNFVPVPFVYMHADTRHVNYTATNKDGAIRDFSLSIAQLNYAVGEQMKVKTTDAPADAATPASPQDAKKERAAQQAKAEQAKSAESTTEPGLSGKADRSVYISELNKCLMSIARIVELDTVGALTYADFTPGSWTAAVNLAIVVDRITERELASKDTGRVKKAKAA